jgi:hypothetical protein
MRRVGVTATAKLRRGVAIGQLHIKVKQVRRKNTCRKLLDYAIFLLFAPADSPSGCIFIQNEWQEINSCTIVDSGLSTATLPSRVLTTSE